MFIFRQQLLCDLNVKIENEIVYAHKIVLASNSNYFYQIFTGSFEKSYKEEIRINNITPNAFKLLVDFMYTSKLKITEYNVQVK